jgi:UDP-N-acetylglucosamine 2-epimerase (non-hydrolysing)
MKKSIKKILISFGTRPEAIKMAPVYFELKSRPELDVKLCVTAQHRSMLDQVLTAFGITPDYDLNIMRQRQTLNDILCNVLTELDPVLEQYKPDLLLVHGDTHTTLASALAAFHRQIQVGHVEAGLRTWNKLAPYPEEVTRQMVDDIADFYFAPTELSKQNLLKEGKEASRIFVTGNTEIDALRYTVKENYSHPVLDWAKGSRLILMECHRRENLGQPLVNVFNAVRRVLSEVFDAKVVFPVHLNPAVQEPVNAILGDLKNVCLIPPLEVTDFHNFMKHSYFILTDSGGIQEGAAGLSKPVLVVRDVTERPEGLDAGVLELVGTSEERVYNALLELLTNKQKYSDMASAKNPYGDGFAAQRIADAILSAD